jgi:predicted MPP superfamily phosphohydrolase
MQFLTLVITAVTFMSTYIYFSVLQSIEPVGVRIFFLVILAGLLAALLWMPLSYWKEEKKRNPVIEQFLLYSAYTGMAIISFSLALAILKDILLLATRHSPWHSESASWAVLALTAACCGFGYWSATQNLKIKAVEVIDAKLPSAFDGLKIIQISDLHVGPTIKKEYVERVVELSNRAAPDLICLTGDMIDGEVKDLFAEIEPLRNLQATLGKFYVLGNHEYYWDAMGWRDALEKLGFKPLLNEHATLLREQQKFHVVGLTDPAAAGFKLEKPNFEKAMQGIPVEDFKLLLVHQPQYSMTAVTLPIQLQLSGHTHGVKRRAAQQLNPAKPMPASTSLT